MASSVRIGASATTGAVSARNAAADRLLAPTEAAAKTILAQFPDASQKVEDYVDTGILDGLLGEPLPLPWDDVTYARTGTGRFPVSAADRAALGDLAGRFPLFG